MAARPSFPVRAADEERREPRPPPIGGPQRAGRRQALPELAAHALQRSEPDAQPQTLTVTAM
jgi:hypothetical protein